MERIVFFIAAISVTVGTPRCDNIPYQKTIGRTVQKFNLHRLAQSGYLWADPWTNDGISRNNYREMCTKIGWEPLNLSKNSQKKALLSGLIEVSWTGPLHGDMAGFSDSEKANTRQFLKNEAARGLCVGIQLCTNQSLCWHSHNCKDQLTAVCQPRNGTRCYFEQLEILKKFENPEQRTSKSYTTDQTDDLWKNQTVFEGTFITTESTDKVEEKKENEQEYEFDYFPDKISTSTTNSRLSTPESTTEQQMSHSPNVATTDFHQSATTEILTGTIVTKSSAEQRTSESSTTDDLWKNQTVFEGTFITTESTDKVEEKENEQEYEFDYFPDKISTSTTNSRLSTPESTTEQQMSHSPNVATTDFHQSATTEILTAKNSAGDSKSTHSTRLLVIIFYCLQRLVCKFTGQILFST